MTLPRLNRPEIRQRERQEEALAARLSGILGRPIAVRLTRNRKRLLSVRSDRRGHRTLRAHCALATADDGDLAVIASWLNDAPGSSEAARTLFSKFRDRIDEVSSLRAGRPPRATAVPGRHHDLNDILREIQGAFFPDMETVYIAWSGREGRARRRRLGSWSPRERLIRMHSVLDDPKVPRYFVAHVVHHELCHAALDPPLTPTGRRRVHGREFQRLEAEFPDLSAAREWERRNAKLLLG
jgi:predicted SprT family Zn-dependent metalloprotease